jgi:hypothetical protein
VRDSILILDYVLCARRVELGRSAENGLEEVWSLEFGASSLNSFSNSNFFLLSLDTSLDYVIHNKLETAFDVR